jgi:hypothetical protein
MQTTNLQEILSTSTDDLNHASSMFQSQNEFNYLAKGSKIQNSLEPDEIIEDTLAQSANEKFRESESAKDLKQGTIQVLVKDYQGILQQDYLLDTEEELINLTAALNNRAQTSFLANYWTIGKCILDFYKKEYGTDKLRRISTATGIGVDSLQKACKFAREYSQEQVEKLLGGTFALSWSQITHNLTVEPGRLLEVYEKAENPNQFHDAVMKLKSPAEKRGKSRKAGNIDEQVNVPIPGEFEKVGNLKEPHDILLSEDQPGEDQLLDGTEEPGHYEADEVFKPEEIDELPNIETPDIEPLLAEMEGLKGQLEEANERAIRLDEQFNLLNEELDQSEKQVRKLRKIMKRIIGMVTDGDDHLEIFATYQYLKDLEDFDE